MNSTALLPIQRGRQRSTWSLLFLLLVSQFSAVVHAADLGAHDSEPCEICLVKNSSDDDFILASEVRERFTGFEILNTSSAYDFSYYTPSNHSIRAPPQ